MNDYVIPLSVDLPIFNTNLKPIEYLKSLPIWANNVETNFAVAKIFKLIWQTQLSSQLNQFFLEHGQTITWCEIFYKKPNTFSIIHTDCEKSNDFAKVNWVLGGKDSAMHWYTIKDSYIDHPENHVSTLLGAKPILYQLEDLNLVHSEHIQGPALIQGGVPHNITTINDERWCLSIVFSDNKLCRRPTFSEGKEIFKKYLI